MTDDLRSFIDALKSGAARDYLAVTEPMDCRWQLAAFTEALVKKMRMPVIEYSDVNGSNLPVIHNVCASLSRIAKSRGWSVAELESRLDSAYDHQIAPVREPDGPVRENLYTDDAVDLLKLPGVIYTEAQTEPYLSAAHVVAFDTRSEAINVSFHRLMIIDRNSMAIYMTPNGHLDQIFRHNQTQGRDTPIAAFIGAHPLWSLGALAAGALSVDELSVIGGLLGYPLPVVSGIYAPELMVPACAEIAIEGHISCTDEVAEGPYGEAFGYVSQVSDRPVVKVSAVSHRNNPLFQDIVPGQLEHLTMTGVAVAVYLKKNLKQRYRCITDVHLPTPMTVHVAVSEAIKDSCASEILKQILKENRFVKHAVMFDQDIDISNSKQTQNAIAMQVQAHRDVVILPEQTGNGLDPSELQGLTTKWGIDASSYAKYASAPEKNRIPQHVFDHLDVNAILDKKIRQ